MSKEEKQSKEEKLYECEVKRYRKIEGKRIPFWKTKTVLEALEDQDTEFRCKDCHGAVKLFKRRVAAVPAPHVEHTSREDSEYCPSGVYFKEATDGREPRLSEMPVK